MIRSLDPPDLDLFRDENDVALCTSTLLSMGAPVVLCVIGIADHYLRFSLEYAGWPFLLSLLVVGIPHGAVDFVIAIRQCRARTVRIAVLSFLPYLIQMGMVLVALLVWPAGTMIVFVVLSVLHFSASEYRELLRRSPDHQGLQLISAISRGVIVLALPFALSGMRTVALTNQLLSLVGSASRIGDAEAVELVAQWLLGLFASGILLSGLGKCFAKPPYRGTAIATELLEFGGLILSFALLDPLFAVGVYFLVWHSLRHFRELCEFLWPADDFERVLHFLRGVVRIHFLSLPLLLPTIMVFAVMASFLVSDHDPTELALLVIVIFVIVTLPHHLQVQGMFASSPVSPSAKSFDAAHCGSLHSRARRISFGRW